MAADWKKVLGKLKIDTINEQKEKEKVTDEKLTPGRIIEIRLSEEDGLILKNEADYASFVESKGFEVAGSAAIRTEKRLKDRFER